MSPQYPRARAAWEALTAGARFSSGNSLVETFQSASPYASRGTGEGVGRQTHVRRMPGARRRSGRLLRKLLDRRAGLGHGDVLSGLWIDQAKAAI